MTRRPIPLDLFPNGALSFDPDFIGRIEWPNNASLPADLNLALTRFIMEMIADEDLYPHNQILRALYSLPGMLAFNLSYFRLATEARKQNLAGFTGDETNPLVTLNSRADAIYNGSRLKDYASVFSQKIILQIAALLGQTPQLTVSASGYYPEGKFGIIWRLRRADAIPRIFKGKPGQSDLRALSKITDLILEEANRLAITHEIYIDQHTKCFIRQQIANLIEKTWQDFLAYKKFFNGKAFHYFERSLTPYQSALIATVCHEAGGSANSTYHGVCQTANEPDIVTMANARHFWAPTPAFAEDARKLSDFIPPALRQYDIRCYEGSDHYKRFIRLGDKPRDKIRHIAIMGRHMVMRNSAFNILEFPFYLDFEKRLGGLLVQQGYEVSYKAHPESDWRHFGSFFDRRIKIDWDPFEKVMDRYDAVVYHFGASSTLPYALGSHQHLFMIQDGWHDQRIWPPRLINFFREYANMLPSRINKNGLIEWDEEIILDHFSNPKPVSPENRIRDFFCKRYD